MKLLDAAEVVTEDPDNWRLGWDGDARGCGNVAVYLSECEPDEVADIVGDSSDLMGGMSCGYRVIPFGFIATLARNSRTMQEDDAQWLATALRDGSEIPVARGLLIRQGRGAALGDTWIGNPDVQEIPAPALTDQAAVRAAVTDARAEFFRRTFAIEPVLHVNPTNALDLRSAGVIQIDPVTGDDRTVWGDPVVISQGYYDIPGLSAVPPAFFTGPIKIRLSTVNTEDVLVSAQRNQSLQQVSRMAAIDTPPCAMVRIGPAPAPVG
jgi:hypothetical protein